MRLFLIIELIFSIYIFANCQEDPHSKVLNEQKDEPIQISIHDNNSDSILIRYTFDKLLEDSAKFIIPRVIPGTYRFNDITQSIKGFHCYAQDNHILATENINNYAFLIHNSKKLKKIEYYVQKGNYKSVYDVLTKYVTTNTYSIINTFSFLGYIDGYRKNKYILNIQISQKNNNNDYINRSSKLLKGYQYNYNNYAAMVENPHVYCNCDTTFINKNDFKASIQVYSDNKNITSLLIKRWISPLTKVLSDYTSIVKNDTIPYRFIFIFSDRFERYAALEQKNSSTYCFPSNWDTAFLSKTIQHISAHEYLHKISPLYFCSDTLERQLYNNFSSKHLWLYEGLTEYLALKANLDANLISLNRFIEYLSMMYSYVDSNSQENNKNLLNTSQDILNSKDFSSFQDFYNKGGLIAFCMDLEISITTNGRKDLIVAISDYIAQNGRIFNEKEFIRDFLKASKLNNIDTSIFNSGLLSLLNESLQQIGYYYSDEQKPWVESVFNQHFISKYYEKDNSFFIQFNENADLKNKKIRLLKLAQENVEKEEVQKKLIYPPNANPVKIMYEHNNEIKIKTIKPIKTIGYKMIRRIKQQEKLSETQEKNLKYFINK
ncbi:M61 family metallopeptidase [Salinivirga cyanobacteriivorans]